MRTDRLLASSLALAVASAAHAQVHVYVDDDAPDGGNGLSWNSAMNDLHRAIDIAQKLGEFRGEIRIAGGIYTPDQGTGDRTMAFVIPIDQVFVKPYRLVGGYAGHSDLGNPDVRDTDIYRSILDADLLGNDTADSDSRTDNSENIFVVGDGTISGFTALSGVSLDGLEFRGASVGAVASMTSAVSLSFRGCSFTNNMGGAGSVMKLGGVRVDIDGCTAAHNISTIPVGGFGGGAFDFDDCIVNIHDSVFENNSSRLLQGSAGDAHGGAISARFGRLDITQSRFRSNRSHGDGGAVFLNDVWANIVDTEFEINVANVGNIHGFGNGGGVYATGGNVRIDRCEFAFNSAQWGGAVFGLDEVVINDSVFYGNFAAVGGAFAGQGNIVECEFTFCSTTGSGGAAFLITGSLVDNSVFRNNLSGTGGAIGIGESATGSSPITIRNSIFENNISESRGGAIRDPYSDDDVEVNITDCEFRQNTSKGLAGAVFGGDEISGSVFEGNSAQSDGGAVHSAAYLVGCEFTGNSAQSDGGAVHSVPLVEDCQFVGNIAEGGRGGGTLDVPTILRSSFVGNSARFGGGAHNPTFVDTCSFIQNSTIAGGGGIALLDAGDVFIGNSVFADNVSNHSINGSEIQKAGLGELTLVQNSFARTETAGQAMLTLAGGQTWIESTTIWDEAWGGSAVVAVAEGSQLALIHTNLRMEPAALAADDPNDLFFLGGNISGDPRYADAAAGDLRLRPGSPLIDAGFVFGSQDGAVNDVYGGSRDAFDDLGMVNIGQGADGYLDIGAVEFRGESCFADVNGDGALTSTDFTAWIAAYGAGDAVADQNRDRVLTPSDFTAWINNFNAGCP